MMTPPRQAAAHFRMRRKICRGPPGAFTLIEVVVALVLFGFGMLALEGAALLIVRQARDARVQTLATTLAGSRLELLSHAACAAIAPGTHEERGIRLEWSPGEILLGRARVVKQTARFSRRGSAHVESYIAAVPCR